MLQRQLTGRAVYVRGTGAASGAAGRGVRSGDCERHAEWYTSPPPVPVLALLCETTASGHAEEGVGGTPSGTGSGAVREASTGVSQDGGDLPCPRNGPCKQGREVGEEREPDQEVTPEAVSVPLAVFGFTNCTYVLEYISHPLNDDVITFKYRY